MNNAVFGDVALLITDVFEERRTSIISVKRFSELGSTLAVCSSETSALTRATRCHIPEDGILHNHRRENLKS
jgi:hypothetical protein